MKRIQRSRAKGWRMPEGAVYVGRPTKWGNPHVVEPALDGTLFERAALLERRRHNAVATYEYDLRTGRLGFNEHDVRRELGGRDLVCWCPVDQPCHADVLLRIANTGWAHDEWVEIGKRCSAGRRSLWMRLVLRQSDEIGLRPEDVEAIELKAGREGHDSEVRITHDNPQFRELLDLFTTAHFAATT